MAGIFYGWIGIYYGQYAYMYDTWGYHYLSVDEYKLLFHNPSEYFFNIFHSGYENKYGGFFRLIIPGGMTSRAICSLSFCHS